MFILSNNNIPTLGKGYDNIIQNLSEDDLKFVFYVFTKILIGSR